MKDGKFPADNSATDDSQVAGFYRLSFESREGNQPEFIRVSCRELLLGYVELKKTLPRFFANFNKPSRGIASPLETFCLCCKREQRQRAANERSIRAGTQS